MAEEHDVVVAEKRCITEYPLLPASYPLGIQSGEGVRTCAVVDTDAGTRRQGPGVGATPSFDVVMCCYTVEVVETIRAAPVVVGAS